MLNIIYRCMPCKAFGYATFFPIVLGLLFTGTAAADFSEPIVVSGKNTGEPGIELSDADHMIYITAPPAASNVLGLPGSPSHLFRSDDNGQSFVLTNPGSRSSYPGGTASDVTVDPEFGNVFISDSYVAGSTVSVSSNRGESWDFSNPVGGIPVQGRQWLSTPDGITLLRVVYHAYQQLPLGILVSKSIDGSGLSFVTSNLAASAVDNNIAAYSVGPVVSVAGCGTLPGPFPPDGGGCALPPHGLVKPLLSGLSDDKTLESGGEVADVLLETNQLVGVIYATASGGIRFARSTDGATTFTQNVVSRNTRGVDVTRSFPVVAASKRLLAAVWLEVIDQRSRVRFSRSSDFGANWSTPITLVAAGTSVYPWVDIDNGRVKVVLYHNPTAEATPDTVPENSDWFAAYLESSDRGMTFSDLTVIDPLPAKSGPVCTLGDTCTQDRELGGFLSVATDYFSTHVAWIRVLDEQTGDTEIRYAQKWD